jgi:hypothetical protein
MELYSQEAQRLLIKWNCMTKNMSQSALMRFHHLDRQAAKSGPEGMLKHEQALSWKRASASFMRHRPQLA